MQLPLQITFRHMQPSEAVEAKIREYVTKLDKFYDRIIECHVVVEAPHQRHREGNLYHICIDLSVPGGKLVVRRNPPARQVHEDIYVAVRDAFHAARRKLQDYARHQRGDVKTHAAPH